MSFFPSKSHHGGNATGAGVALLVAFSSAWAVDWAAPPDPLILPAPREQHIEFVPVFLQADDPVGGTAKFLMGMGGQSINESPTEVEVGGSFRTTRDGTADWFFYMAKTEVTANLFNAVMRSAGQPAKQFSGAGDLPAVGLTYLEVQNFLDAYNRWLSNKAGDVLPADEDGLKAFLRLPTEQEWEFAARGGRKVSAGEFSRKTPYGEEPLEEFEWFSGPSSSHNELQPAGKLKPNSLGLHDMLGNASEMTGSPFQLKAGQGPTGGLVKRGGNFRTRPEDLRSSLRGEFAQYDVSGDNKGVPELGFRLVLAAPIFSDIARVEELENLMAQDSAELISSEENAVNAKSGLINRRLESPSHYPWKTNILAKLFFVGEPIDLGIKNSKPRGHSFRSQSVWDKDWIGNYGGVDDPDPGKRRGYIPLAFVPRQNPFYVALPYNDVGEGATKPEAPRVIPWFRAAFVRAGRSVCKGRWVVIRHRGREAYAQWEDCGPFRTDHWQYVFANRRPLPEGDNEPASAIKIGLSSIDSGPGICVSPAVRDYLGLDGTALCDWRFVEFREVPRGPWDQYGDNNTFVILRRRSELRSESSSDAQQNNKEAKSIRAPFGMKWGSSPASIKQNLDKASAKIIHREVNADSREIWSVDGIRQEGLTLTRFFFSESGLEEIRLHYERSGWSHDRILRWVQVVKQQADGKYGMPASVSPGNTEGDGKILAAWRWTSGESSLLLLHYLSNEDGRSADQVVLGYTRNLQQPVSAN